jgi:CelD/BcsL family acetyltransferase involved in cellulose biosynthesis
MNVRVLSPAHLTVDHMTAWAQMQTEDPALDSPFFRPEFTQSVAAVRDDVEVAVLEDGGRPVGFFPYQRDRGDIGRPVGGYMSDFQGPILEAGRECSPRELIRGCGLRAWHFDHLVSHARFQPFHWLTAASPYMDLSRGFDAYRAGRCNQSSTELMQLFRKTRKVQRERGPVRYEPHCTAADVLDTLIAWKMEQYRRMKVVNYLQPAWTRELLHRLFVLRDRDFGGVLSALYVGERLAAARFDLRSRGVLHVWILAYDVSLAKYSPGSLLLLETARSAQALGIERIDLGKGNERYKQQFMSGATFVAEGSVDLRPMTSSIRRRWRCTRELVRASPLRAPAQYVIRNARSWWLYR